MADMPAPSSAAVRAALWDTLTSRAILALAAAAVGLLMTVLARAAWGYLRGPMLPPHLAALPRPPVVRVEGGPMLLAVAKAFRRDPIGFLREQCARYGTSFQLRLPLVTMNFFVSPRHQMAFFRVSDQAWRSSRAMDDFSIDQAFFERCRPLVHPTITPEVVKQFMKQVSLGLNRAHLVEQYRGPAVEAAASILAMYGSKPQPVDLFEMTSTLAIHIAVRVLLGTRFAAAHADEMVDVVLGVERDVASPLNSLLPGWPLPPNLRMRRAMAKVTAWVNEEIAKRREDGRQGVKHRDYLEILLGSEAHAK
ncbi:hypothetical protein HK105_205960 [Polyrhizophydium stewartii]|uniref:Cytochrome P450 n=1 Tax=Polyrhizophydium stewartii TaxID=2732419 RepID=A0ABR4N541_9FUNG